MQLGMIGLGRMGGEMALRLTRAGHACVVYDRDPDRTAAIVASSDARAKAVAATSLRSFVERLTPPRAIWLMLPAAAVDGAIKELVGLLGRGDILIDGGNSHYIDDIRRAEELKAKGIHYVDVGTSGGVWGLERGYCMMIGGEPDAVQRLTPIFEALAPGEGPPPPTEVDITDDKGKVIEKRIAQGTAVRGYLHCGPPGAGHFVKMGHNGIEYGLMEAYAEGLNILKHANVGKQGTVADAETTPLRTPGHYQYDLDLAAITEVWRRGSVISSWLLDLTAMALLMDPHLSRFTGEVSDSGEGRWTALAAIEEGVPVPAIGTALFARFMSREKEKFSGKLLSAMRFMFGRHLEKGHE